MNPDDDTVRLEPPISDAAELYLMVAEILHIDARAKMGLTDLERSQLQSVLSTLDERMSEEDRARVGRWIDKLPK